MLHLWLRLLMQSLIYIFLHNGSFKGGPDVALEGAVDVGLNVRLKEHLRIHLKST